METAVQFKNPKGHTLHGILHRPDGPVAPNAPAVLWMSAGQKDRLGAWRMNLVVCRRLAELGVPSLRFDFHGIGDSEGEHPANQFVMDLYGFIQTGGFRDDAVAGAQLLLQETGAKKLILAGLCGGAITGLYAGAQLPNVYGHYLVDLPVTISSAARQKYLEENPVELLRTNPLEAETVWLLYLKKVADLQAWRRLLSGESDYDLLREAVRQKVRGGVDKMLPLFPKSAQGMVDKVLKPLPPPPDAPKESAAGEAPKEAPAEPGPTATGEVRNERVAPAFRAILDAGQRVRFLNSSTYHPTFMAYFGAQHVAEAEADRKGYDLTVVPDANHIFSLENSQRMLFEGIEGLVRDAMNG